MHHQIYTAMILFNLLAYTIAQQPPIPESTVRPEGPAVPLEHLCQPNRLIPDDLTQCGTCQNRCGRLTKQAVISSGSTEACSCDIFCIYNRDCCENFQEFCPDVYMESQQSTANFPASFDSSDFECREFNKGTIKTKVVTTCSDGSSCPFTLELSEDVNAFVPMYDTDKGVHYISGHCAVCNGATRVTPWGVSLECSALTLPSKYQDSNTINNTEAYEEVRLSSACQIFYSISGTPRACASEITSECSPQCQNTDLVSRCQSQSQGFVSVGDVIYRNPHCAICNLNEYHTGDLNCGQPVGPPGIILPDDVPAQPGILSIPEIFRPSIIFKPGQVIKPAPPASFSLTLVFDFDPRKGLTVGEHAQPECASNEIYVQEEDECRLLTCPSGMVLHQSECIADLSNITLLATGTTGNSIMLSNNVLGYTYKQKISLKQRISQIMDTFNISHINLQVNIDVFNTNKTIILTILIQCNCEFGSIAESNSTRQKQEFEENLLKLARAHILTYAKENNITLESINNKIDLPSGFNHITDLKSQSCIWIVYRLDEVFLDNNTIKVLSNDKLYDSDFYEIFHNTVIICINNAQDFDVDQTSNVDLALSIITLVCVGISIICLVARVILQFIVSHFQTRPGKLQLQVSLALLFTFIWLVIGPFLSGNWISCSLGAILLAYGFLATFTWMNVIAIDTWLVFKPSSAFARANDGDKNLLKHILIGWGIPLVLISASIITNHINKVPDNFDPKFGGTRCWYTERYAMLIYFGMPIAISILLNIFFYIDTAINLHKAFHNESATRKVKGNHFTTYVRLFIMMGITWVFGFVSAFTDQVVIDFIFVILTSLQGLFLFISFVCNKRVLSEIKKHAPAETSSSENKRTKSTPLPSYEISSTSLSHGKRDSVV